MKGNTITEWCSDRDVVSEVELRGDGDAYLEPVCLHGVISKAVPEEANQIKRKENVKHVQVQWQMVK